MPYAYGGTYYLEGFDSHGGWIATTADLLRFATAVDGQRGTALLPEETVEVMISTPRPSTGAASAGSGVSAEVKAGLGWDITVVAPEPEWWRVGALFGSSAAWVTRRPDGVAIAYAFNGLPVDYLPFLDDGINGLNQAADAVSEWPEGDLFSTE